jgi:hypothetical protein
MIKFSKEEVDFNRIYHFTAEEMKDIPLHTIRVPSHANKIYKDLIGGKAKHMAPIIINAETMSVIDGGNRVTAYKRAWDEGYDFKIRAIFEDIPKEEEGDEVVTINTTQNSWGIRDFKKKLDDECNESIMRYNEFALSHDFCHGKFKKDGTAPINMRYTMAFLLGRNDSNNIKDGSICITQEDVDFANEIYPEVAAIYNTLGYTSSGGWFETMIHAWYHFRDSKQYSKRFERFGFDKYLEKLKDGFDTEQVTSSSIWESRFSSVLVALETASKL